MSILIKGGHVIDPKNKVSSKLNVYIKDHKIYFIISEDIAADTVIDASGKIVCPGFIDIHIHEGKLNKETKELDDGIFKSMLNMGVTSAVGGNCGVGSDEPIEYLDYIDSVGIPINLGLLLPHEILRKRVGIEDKYAGIEDNTILNEMNKMAKDMLDKGLFGISFGIRYIPGMNTNELLFVSKAAQQDNKIISAHIRDDAENVLEAAEELINVSKLLDLPIQISHIGSMAAYGQMEKLLSLMDYSTLNGVDVSADCYPYNAFSTGIGETTYDDGFLDRYKIDYSNIEIAEGKYKGQRCDERIFHEVRTNNPETITIGHVMNEKEVEAALCHPNVMVASDGFLHGESGHPRAAGTFPRAIFKYCKHNKLLSLEQIIEKMTWQPAKRYGLKKGSIEPGFDGDVVIFDLENIRDNAAFEEPFAEPSGIHYVIINGEIAVKDGNIVNGSLGRSLRR